MISLILSRETLEALHACVAQHCPCALEDPEFLPALVVVLEDEVVAVVNAERAAAREACWKLIRKAGVPCRN